MKVILPNTHVEMSVPLIFLAGPILSAPRWQDEAIAYFAKKGEESLLIASPRRGRTAAIAPYVIDGNQDYFPRQRAWERHYLDIAARTGAIMFWLPGEETHDCRKVYGATTRMELGQWMTRYRRDKTVRFCAGTDGRFSEVDIIVYDLQQDAPDKKMHTTLEETCEAALQLVNWGR